MALVIDTRDFTAAMREYQRATKKDGAYVVNRAGMNLAFRAAQFTTMADRGQVEAYLRSQVATKVFTKTGKRLKRPKAIFRIEPRARAIYIWERRDRGEAIPSNVSKVLPGWIASRVGSVGFIRAGFLPAAYRLSKAVRIARNQAAQGIGRKRPGKGYGKEAREFDRLPACEIVNTSTSKSKSSPQALFRYATEGLRKALVFVAADMRQYIREKLGVNARRFNRR